MAMDYLNILVFIIFHKLNVILQERFKHHFEKYEARTTEIL